MGIAKYIAPALSVASLAVAQSSCSASTTTLSNGGDIAAVAACTTFTGNVVVESGAAVNNAVVFDGLKELDGDLTYSGDNTVQTFSADTLDKISGTFSLMNLTALSSINMPKFNTAGNIDFVGLGGLGSLGFGSPGLASAGNITIDNTQIGSLAGIDNVTQLAGINVINNPLLSQISLGASKIQTVLVGVNGQGTDRGVTVMLPNLTSSDTIIVRNSSSVSIPSLSEVTSILAFIGNYFETFEAPNLTWAGGVVMDDNGSLNNMSFPELTAINGSHGTLVVANNTKLDSIAGFPVLTQVQGGVQLFGSFGSAHLPKINQIKGALTIDTSSSSFNCSSLPKTGQGIVRGKVTCVTGDKNPNQGGTGVGSSAATSSSAAFANEIPANFMPIFGIIAGLLFA